MQGVYYDVNGQLFCEGCRQQLQASLDSGSAFGRFARATLYGSLAGLLGAAVYYGVTVVTEHQFGLIAILVGLMIGKAVKKGSDARGGWFYQGLAMFLTYSAIVLTYIPPVIDALRNPVDEKPAAAKLEQPANVAGDADAPADVPEAAGARPRPSIKELPMILVQLLTAVVALVGLAYALPVLLNFDSPIGLIIIGIGLYEAWTTNRRIPIVIKGPYQIGQAGAGGAVHVEPAG